MKGVINPILLIILWLWLILCDYLLTRLVRSTAKEFSVAAAADTMSGNGRCPGLDLKLNLSPPPADNRQRVDSPNRSASPTSSCVSLELNMETEGDAGQALRISNSPDAMSMVLVGCLRCLMYVMLSDGEEPKCPKCKSSVLLDVQSEQNSSSNTVKKSKKN